MWENYEKRSDRDALLARIDSISHLSELNSANGDLKAFMQEQLVLLF